MSTQLIHRSKTGLKKNPLISVKLFTTNPEQPTEELAGILSKAEKELKKKKKLYRTAKSFIRSLM